MRAKGRCGSLACLGVAIGCSAATLAERSLPVLTTAERTEFSHAAFLESRRERLGTIDNPFLGPPLAKIVEELPRNWNAERYPWHYQTRATIFWVGEKPSPRNPTPNHASAWDPQWVHNFGGYDHPFRRSGYRPADFEPKLNPFYVALPYNDLLDGYVHRPEASSVIPWFWRAYRGAGISVCENRWIAIHHQGRVCFAQWKDVGPFTIDDWQYVFRGEKPRANPNANAGIDISPAVRDFLELESNADVDWRFVEDYEVPAGPWSKWLGSQAGPFGQPPTLPSPVAQQPDSRRETDRR